MASQARRELAVSVRAAGVPDAERLAELCTQLGYPSSRQEVLRRLEQMLRSRENVVYVATLADGRVIGWVHAYVSRLLESDATAELGGLVVDENYRRSGAGRALVHYAERWARAQGCATVTLRSNIIREAAHKFYLDLGYTPVKTQYAFRKKL